MGNTSWSGERTSFPPARRRRILKRHPTCQCNGCPHCGTRCTAPSTIADHQPNYATLIRAGVTDPHDERYGRGMCAPCHDHKTRGEQRAGQQRTSRKRPPEQHPGRITHV